VAGVDSFSERYGTPHAPVLTAFGGDRLHVCRLHGSWNLEQMVADHAPALFRSIRLMPTKAGNGAWDDLTFRFGPRTFVYADAIRVVSFASTPAEAEHLVTQFSKLYLKPHAPIAGGFNLIQFTPMEIDCHHVPLPPDIVLSPESLRLHYGSDGETWHQDFVEKLHAKNHGLSILEGRPGTGKTFYLRHLAVLLNESHRFYFIPTASMDILSRPDFIGFWAGQRERYSDQKLVVILEDSDAALMTRGADNREQVSAILNLSDGFLADFLRLQIICTINCTSADIDQALLRPGRLLCHRIFRRLDYAQAARLAESLGRRLPVASDYSLAEVFTGQEKHETNNPHIGFGDNP
jgi:hypothetical protein